jgi:CRISPR-associated endonuclease Csy4
MKYYLDITLIPDLEVNLGFLWKKVYQQIHLALVDAGNKVKNSDASFTIAVSFPEYGDKVFPLGSKLRLFAITSEALSQLEIDKWLVRLSDYVHLKPVQAVPESVTYACFTRQQLKTNVNRLARRRAKRKGESLEQALNHYVSFEDNESKLPFVNMMSLSSSENSQNKDDHQFRLFIAKEVVSELKVGVLNSYGLSSRDSENQTTVPCF